MGYQLFKLGVPNGRQQWVRNQSIPTARSLGVSPALGHTGGCGGVPPQPAGQGEGDGACYHMEKLGGSEFAESHRLEVHDVTVEPQPNLKPLLHRKTWTGRAVAPSGQEVPVSSVYLNCAFDWHPWLQGHLFIIILLSVCHALL